MKKKLGGVFTIVITTMMAFFMMIPFVGGIDSAYAEGESVTYKQGGIASGAEAYKYINGAPAYCMNPNLNTMSEDSGIGGSNKGLNYRLKYSWGVTFQNQPIQNFIMSQNNSGVKEVSKEQIAKILYLGYPYNAKGIGDGISEGKFYAATQKAIFDAVSGNAAYVASDTQAIADRLRNTDVLLPDGWNVYCYLADRKYQGNFYWQNLTNLEFDASINTKAKTNKSDATEASDGAVEIKIPAGEEKTGLGTVWDVVNYKGLKANNKYALTVQLKDSSGNVLRARENAAVNTGSSADGTWDMNALNLQMWPESVGEGTYYFDVKVYEISENNEYTLVAMHDGSSDPKEQFRVTKDTNVTSSEETSSEETSSEETSSEETSSEETSSEETSSEETSSEETSSEETSSEETSSEEISSEETSSEETSSEETSSEETTTDEEPTTEEFDNDKIEELEGKLKTTVNCEGQSGSESSAAQVVIEGDSVVTDVTDKIDYEGLKADSTYEVKGQLVEVETDKVVATATEKKVAEASDGTWEITFKGVTIEAGKTYVVYEHATEVRDKNNNVVENAETIKHEDKNDKAQTIVVAKEEEETVTNSSEEETTTVESVYETPSTDSVSGDGTITGIYEEDTDSAVLGVYEEASDIKTADNSGSSSSGSGTSTKGAKTGDSSPISLLVVMATIAAAAVSMMVVRRKREDR